jgi:exopolysaccharide biosynthesis polyprenyl glycosylphosphotransferase
MILVLGDIAAACVSLSIALFFWGTRDNWLDFSLAFLRERPPFWFYLLPVVWVLLLTELYDVRKAGSRKDTLQGIAGIAIFCLGIYLLVFFLSPPASLPRLGMAVFIVSATLLTLLWRMVYIGVFNAPQFMRRVLIVGAGRAGSSLAAMLRDLWPPPFYLVGLIDDDPDKVGIDIEKYSVLGGSAELLQIARDQNISDLIFAISGQMNAGMFQALITAEEQGITVTSMPAVYEEILGRVPIFFLDSEWILRSFVDHAHTGEFYEVFKRLLDITGGLIGSLGMILLTPLLALMIALDDGFPVFYTQNRLGKNGFIYKMIKFRTMIKDAEKDGMARVTVKNDERMTRIGRYLRKSHLDELPQFINVFRGDMSLVGPRAERPELVDGLQAQVPFYRARFLVRPGLTGWAQINYHYASTITDTGIKLEYDLYYIKHRNLMLDFIIMLRTFGTVIGFRGQ